jgi:acetyl-CoA carboxylase biotin carboxyl carrier protein
MDLEQIEELVELMRRSGVTELSLELPDYKISIKRGAEGESITASPAADVAARPGEHEQAREEAELAEALPVVSPVVGVFHNGGMAGPRELVKEGDRVERGQLLAAIEAMKVPNELRAPVSGLVWRLLVQDGAAVEYGQTLFLIHPEEGGEANEGESLLGLA